MANLGAINWHYQGDLYEPDSYTPQSPAPAQMYNYLLQKGANSNEAHMLTGAAASESDLNPHATHDGGVGYGMFGHNGSRLLAMKQYAGQTGGQLSDWRTQAGFALNELRSRPEGAAVANATTPEQLALGEMHYEQPQGFTAANPEAGHNFTGRLNTIRTFAALNPSATGAFSPSANPQVSAGNGLSAGGNANGAGTGISGGLGNGAGNAAAAPVAATSAATNPFASVGNNPSLNNAIFKLVHNSVNPGNGQQQGPLSGLLSGITQPAHNTLHSGLMNLLGGGSGSSVGASSSPASSPSTPAPTDTPLPSTPAADIPLPPPRPPGLTPAPDPATVAALGSSSVPDLSGVSSQTGGASASPLLAQPSVLAALGGLLGGS